MFVEVVTSLLQQKAVPLFIQNVSGKLTVVLAKMENNSIEKNDKLIYLGYPIVLNK